MKINTSEIYTRYSDKLVQESTNLKEDVKNLNNSKEYVLNNLKEHKDFLNQYCDVTYEGLEQVNTSYIQRSILQRRFEGKEELLEKESTVKRMVNVLVEIKKQLKQSENRLKEIENLTVESKVFNETIGKFNTKVIDAILKGYRFHLGFSLSYICIKKKDVSLRKHKRIDWGTSNKNKKKIIEEGGIPYEVLTRTEDGKILTDNGGIYWLAYHNKQVEYMWHWARGRAPFANKFFYKFKPTYCGASNDGCVQKLKQLEASNSEYLKYFN